MSHPVWVRGLKRKSTPYLVKVFPSHPVWVRGLKLRNKNIIIDTGVSHPVWVRGLKPLVIYKVFASTLVAPRVGAWIETYLLLNGRGLYCVAPRVGAWIETYV